MSIKFCDFHALEKISNISNHKLYKMPKKSLKILSKSLKVVKLNTFVTWLMIYCKIKYPLKINVRIRY